MADKITRAYKLAATGYLEVSDDNQIYISIEDGPQEVNIATLLKDFSGKNVKFNCSFDNEVIPEEEQKIDQETGEILDL